MKRQRSCLPFHPNFKKNHPSLPSSICINGTNIPFSPLVRSLGVTFVQTVTFGQHISNICKTAYFKLRRISSIHHYFSIEKLMCSFVWSWLDFRNSLLDGSQKYLLRKLQKIQSNTALVVFSTQNSSMFSYFCMHYPGFLPISKSTTDSPPSASLLLPAQILNTLSTFSRFMFLPDSSFLRSLTPVCFKSLKVRWPTDFCTPGFHSPEQTPAQHQGCFLSQFCQNHFKKQTVPSAS